MASFAERCPVMLCNDSACSVYNELSERKPIEQSAKVGKQRLQ